MNRSAFTLMELVLAVIIIGVLATIALARYSSVLERHRADVARKHLEAIFAASDVYLAQANRFPPGVEEDLDFINENFRTNIPDDGTFVYEYICDIFPGQARVTATRSTGAYTLEIMNSRTDSEDVYPAVCSGSCP